jgi:protein O-GlcNAc transferase
MYRGALSSRPDYVEAMVNLGVLLKRTGRLQEAAQCYRDALAIDPALAKLHNNLGNIEMEFGRLGIAEQCFRQAVALDPGLAMAHSNLGNVLKELGRLEEALACYREALRIEPDFAPAHSSLLLALNCVEGVDPAGVYAEHRDFARRLPGPGGPRHENSDRPEGPLRIGYVSGDLRDHPVAHFLEPVLARHDPASFRIFCYSNNAAVDAVTARIRALRVEWREVFGLSDEQVFDLVLRDGIDILVDLSGHTAFNRLGVFARKPAPVQVSWLGYLNTTGLDSMDYRIVDDHTAPAGLLDDFHSERLLRLPASQWCYEPPSGAPAVAPPPSARKGRVTFASFSNFAKMGSATIGLWSRVLSRVEGSRLVLVRKGAESAAGDFKRRFASSGIDPERIEILPSRPFEQYLALHDAVDVVLDTYPYAGATTTCHALWMGVPVVSLAGPWACSRSGASILCAAGLAEFVATDPDQYVGTAALLASDIPRLAELRAGLRERLKASPLLDVSGFTRDLENAYRSMWRSPPGNLAEELL